MRCVKCWKEIPDGTDICPFCHKPQVDPPKQMTRRQKTILTVLGSMIIMLLIFAFALLPV